MLGGRIIGVVEIATATHEWSQQVSRASGVGGGERGVKQVVGAAARCSRCRRTLFAVQTHAVRGADG